MLLRGDVAEHRRTVPPGHGCTNGCRRHRSACH
jgi:hypothetical protein